MLARHNLRIRGASGREIDPNSIDWGRVDIRNYELFQPPGPDNVLGTVKFVFPNKHDVYMHDTTQKNLFAQTVRAESHGCMRVQNPQQLALLLLHHDQGWSQAQIQSALDGEDNHIQLKTHIPVYITYFTLKVDDDGSVSTYNDIYGHDSRMAAALSGKPMIYEEPTAGTDSDVVAGQWNQRPSGKRKRQSRRQRLHPRSVRVLGSTARPGKATPFGLYLVRWWYLCVGCWMSARFAFALALRAD